MKKITFYLMAIAIVLVAVLAACSDKDNNVPVISVSLSQSSATLTTGGTLTLTPAIVPTNATNKNVAWQCSNTAVATVNDGLITAGSVGAATITVITEDGNKTAVCALTVVPVSVIGVALNATSATLTSGSTLTLTATVEPEDAANKNISWQSSSTVVAMVNDGLVTAGAVGAATITVTTEDGGHTATCIVTVPPVPVTGVTLDKAIAELEVNEIMVLTATVTPENATNTNLTWESGNTAVAMVTAGTVTAVAAGTTTITVTTVDGGHTATCVVTVEAPPAMTNCNTNTPGWGTSLGTVSFKSTQTWTIGDQEWSDVVLVSACDKETFDGGSNGNVNADCRNNSGYGDLFSWCAVMRYRKQLCPDGWRVPTAQDLLALDVALGGDGTGGNQVNGTLYAKYISDWGATAAGYCTVNGAISLAGSIEYYWSQTERPDQFNNAYVLYLYSAAGGLVWANNPNQAKTIGSTLRCVR